jgi:hypothetical protein
MDRNGPLHIVAQVFFPLNHHKKSLCASSGLA